jgi:hypothetical protein
MRNTMILAVIAALASSSVADAKATRPQRRARCTFPEAARKPPLRRLPAWSEGRAAVRRALIRGSPNKQPQGMARRGGRPLAQAPVTSPVEAERESLAVYRLGAGFTVGVFA